MSRAISTVVDAALCLLLIGAAVATLAHAPVDDDPAPAATAADETLIQLGTTTATVEYSLTGPDESTDTSAFDRDAHGTLAGLLADAAVGGATIRGERIAPHSTGYEAAVRNATADRIARSEARVNVTARWEPYPGAHVGGVVTVGPEPRDRTDVHVATMTVPSGGPAVASAERSRTDSRGEEFDAVAAAVSNGTVAALFPPKRTEHTLDAHEPIPSLVESRYQRAGAAYELPAKEIETIEEPAAANDRLRTAMVPVVTDELRRSFDDPEAASESARPEHVEITVRTWSP